ncbi:MAG: hypothetical protein KDD28_07260, partial [Phaeodactylibacter sp.]|nr:hypothetical protein [Phaeodactylibacter sp.]
EATEGSPVPTKEVGVGIRKSEQGLKQAFFGGFSAFRLPIFDFDTGFGRVYASVQSPKRSIVRRSGIDNPLTTKTVQR